MVIIRLRGKAYQVFAYIELLAKYQGDKTLKEIENGNTKKS